MRGGAQSHLMRCSDSHYYVVKFQNNPQHTRVLVNELLGTRLAARLGLPSPPVAVIEVSAELIRYTADLVMQLGRGSVPCRPGLQFGSRYPGDPRIITLHDFLPDEQLRAVENIADFAGMLVFDKWTCNTNGRQAIFLRDFSEEAASGGTSSGPGPGSGAGTGGYRTETSAGESTARQGEWSGTRAWPYRTMMIDQGFCFNAGEWNFPDAPLRGLYARQRVYEGVTGIESFRPWLERLEKRITLDVLDEIGKQIPPEWYADEQSELYRLLESLYRRRSRVSELLATAKNSNRRPFPNWS